MQEFPAGRVEFAMNAGMFDDKGAPVGLAVSAGKQRNIEGWVEKKKQK